MALQFKRSVELTIIGTNESIVLTGLRVSFTVEKDIQGYPNLAEISVYNLSRSSRALIQEKGAQVIFNVGYVGNRALIFKGEIRNVTQIQQGVDAITTIYSADGDKAYKEAFSAATFTAGANVKQIVSSVIDTFQDIIPELISGISSNEKIQRALSVNGKSSDVLDTLSENYGFDWSIQDGILKIIDKDGTTSDNIIVIKSNTGMLGSPTVTERGADVKILLNPRAVPYRRIQIESLGANVTFGNLFFRQVPRTEGAGSYKIQKVTHIGDTHTDIWETNLIGILLK